MTILNVLDQIIQLFDYIIIYCSSQLLSTLIVDELNVWLLYII